VIERTEFFVFVIINGSKHVQTRVKSWLSVIEFLQGSAVTQTTLGGLTTLCFKKGSPFLFSL